MNDTYLYRDSIETARSQKQISIWRASHQANIACKNAIEAGIREGFDGMHLQEGCAQKVIDAYGFKRVNWVLANTLREKSWDGRFSRSNKDWSQEFTIPPDSQHNSEFVVETHPAVLDGFVSQVRQAYQQLNLFDARQCYPDSQAELNCGGKILVLSTEALRESCWTPENQLWYAHDGFGCSPCTIDQSIRCTCLGDGETTHWNRRDFVGVLKEEYLPKWALSKMQQLRLGGEPSPYMGEMEMR